MRGIDVSREERLARRAVALAFVAVVLAAGAIGCGAFLHFRLVELETPALAADVAGDELAEILAEGNTAPGQDPVANVEDVAPPVVVEDLAPPVVVESWIENGRGERIEIWQPPVLDPDAPRISLDTASSLTVVGADSEPLTFYAPPVELPACGCEGCR